MLRFLYFNVVFFSITSIEGRKEGRKERRKKREIGEEVGSDALQE